LAENDLPGEGFEEESKDFEEKGNDSQRSSDQKSSDQKSRQKSRKKATSDKIKLGGRRSENAFKDLSQQEDEEFDCKLAVPGSTSILIMIKYLLGMT
jgi:hypothetical protein